MTEGTRLPAIRLHLKGHVVKDYQNPFTLQKELAKCKKIDMAKIKFAKIIGDSNLLMIATADKETHDELSKPWPVDAFTAGVNPPKPRSQSTKATAHNVPIDVDLADPEVAKELDQQGITFAQRRLNKSTNAPTEYVTIHIKSKQALDNLIQNKLKLALCRFRVSVDVKVIQCYKCQRVGHTATQCTNPTTCLRCGENHSHKECNASATLKCANCNGPHAACSRTCPKLKATPKQTPTESGNLWSAVVSNSSKPQQPQMNNNKHKQSQAQQAGPTPAQVQQLIDNAIESKVMPILETLINLISELSIALSHRKTYNLPAAAKLSAASNHINSTTKYNINQESTMNAVQRIINVALHEEQVIAQSQLNPYNAIQADQATTQSQLNQQPIQTLTQQAKRKSRSPSPPSISDITISDPNNTNLDIEISALQTPNNNNSMVSNIKITKGIKNNNNNNIKSNSHNNSKHPNKQTRQSTSMLFNKTVAQSNKEAARNNV